MDCYSDAMNTTQRKESAKPIIFGGFQVSTINIPDDPVMPEKTDERKY